MVLLKGLNYDYSAQPKSMLSDPIGAGQTTLLLDNTEGLETDDYIVIDPLTENSEIRRISTITDKRTLELASAVNFRHSADLIIFKLPYNQMRFYYSSSADGTYTLIDTIDMSYATLFTTLEYPTGTNAQYFKRTLYNETTAVESEIAEADYFQSGVDSNYITTQELRAFCLLGVQDYPLDPELKMFIDLAELRMTLDTDSANPGFLKLASLMLSKSFALRALAVKSVAKGYVTVNIEGRQITKSFQELVLEAENTYSEYRALIRENTASAEATSTKFMNDTTVIDAATRREFIDLWTGTQNAIDYNDTVNFKYGRKRRL